MSIRTVYEYGNICYNNENGLLHREDGPAYQNPSGYKSWFINGKYHREDGPARIFSNGDGWYYLNGQRMSEEEFNNQILKKRLQQIINF